MPTVSSETLHASAVAIGDVAVLIEGPSGSGKSDLALRLIDRGAVLISDDCTMLTRSGEALLAQPPATIAGKIEVRGLGILPMPYVEKIPVALIVRLEPSVARMPEEGPARRIAGVHITEIALEGHAPSLPIKVELALRQVLGTAA